MLKQFTPTVLGLVLLFSHIVYSQNVDPPGTIDGSKHPELISDDISWRLFLRVAGESANATSQEQSRQAAKLQRIGLSPSDQAVLVQKLAKFHDGDASFDSQVTASIKANLGASTRGLVLAREQFIAARRAEIETSLSPEGRAALQKHIQDFKSTIKLYPVPDMSVTSH
jgi:hypothetical protein